MVASCWLRGCLSLARATRQAPNNWQPNNQQPLHGGSRGNVTAARAGATVDSVERSAADERVPHRGGMAESAARSMEGYLRDAASLVADRREDSADAQSVAQPLVARDALRDRARPDDFSDVGRRAHVPDR